MCYKETVLADLKYKEEIESVRAAYTISPGKSVHTPFTELQMPHFTVDKVLRKSLRFYVYEVYLKHRSLRQKLSRVVQSLH